MAQQNMIEIDYESALWQIKYLKFKYVFERDNIL